MALADLIDLTQKKFKKERPDSEINFNLAIDEKPVSGLITHNPQLEFLLDRRFLAYGRFYLGYGKKSSGKTSMFYEFAKFIQAQGGDVVWLETENAADLEYARKQGVDLSRMIIQHPNTLEEALALGELYVRNMPKAYPDGDTPVLIAIDSVGIGTEYEVEAGNTVQNIQPGIHARILSRWYREMVGPLSKEKCIFLMLNQLKQKIGAIGYGDDVGDSLLGGEAQFFYSTYHWKFTKIQEMTAKDAFGAERKIGSRHRIQGKRNKLGREGKGQEAEFDLYIEGGVDWWSPLVRKLGDKYSGLLQKSGGFYYWKPPNTEYINTLPTGEQQKLIIDTEKAFREAELASILANSPQGCDLIRANFGLPELPAPEVVEEVEKERKIKRKKKASLESEEPVETTRGVKSKLSQ